MQTQVSRNYASERELEDEHPNQFRFFIILPAPLPTRLPGQLENFPRARLS